MLKKIKQLKQNAGFMRYFHNTSWLMGERILRMGVGLFVGIWVARYLGPEKFGLLSYAQSFVFLFTAIATLGLDGIVVRELVKDESKRDVLLGTAFGLKLIGAIIILPVLFLAVQFTNNDDYTNLLVFIIASATIFQSFNVIDFYYQSKVLSKYVALANAVALALSSAIKIMLLLNEAPLLAFALMTIFDGLVLAIGLVYFYIKTSGFKLSSWSFNWAMAKGLLNDSWPLILSSFAISIYVKADQIMIMKMLGVESVGQYAAAVKISEAWYFIPVVVANSMFPAIVNAKEISEGFYVKRLQFFFDLMVLLSLLIVVPLVFLSEDMVRLLYGNDYAQATSILMVHACAILFVFMGVASGRWLLNENLQIYSSINTVIGMISNIVINYFLINKVGLIGAAIATVISYAISGYGLLLVHGRTRDVFFMLTKSMFLIGLLQRRYRNGI
ncbi:MAG: flippase [Cycloclasticus sp.]